VASAVTAAFNKRPLRWVRGFFRGVLAVAASSPLLVGLAFECQRVDALPTRSHDVPLDRLVTEAGVRRFTLQDPSNR